MTFFRKPLMSRLSHWWNGSPEFALPLLFFVLMIVHGATIGLTDDEAYYWVLAQKPALGYAYHPPGVAWLIAGAQKLWAPVFGTHSPGVVRFPGIVCASLFLGLGMRWVKSLGVAGARLVSAGWILLSFAGIFALSWMMVPDLPLFLGWSLAFVAVWEICFGAPKRGTYLLAGLGVALALISKYSAVLVFFSAGLALLLWAPPGKKWKGVAAVVCGAAVALLPILIWNAEHEWASLLWQLRDRHQGAGGGIAISLGAASSWIRYGRFWLIELIAAGPVLVLYALGLGLRAVRPSRDPRRGDLSQEEKRVCRYAAVWMFPAALVFCAQPLLADFKPHWAFIVWWPALWVLAWRFARNSQATANRLGRVQLAYGAVLGLVVLLGCHLPIGGWALSTFKGEGFDPRLDVTNDLYGWDELPKFLKKVTEAEVPGKPGAAPVAVVGSRYQTASQAAFSLDGLMKVTMLPTDLKSRDEWPRLNIAEEKNRSRPRLAAAILFVADNRYEAPPDYEGAVCRSLGKLRRFRWKYPAKWIEVWRCEPDGARP